ncbi:hypothetical protein JD516_07110 [Aeromonas jandaei]|uniref:hypothetical protein n=1 Tax=Aeromonas jandaei TaxID=650 RepID=UPI00191F5DAC|nr:hypothetical protein [Aeromonas jandaei]MBL0597588.1 hypothetical protein [Aeromonas jandaei]
MFNKTILALALSTLVGTPSVYAIVSAGTPPVVGFKPVFNMQNGVAVVTGDLTIGSTVSVNTKNIAVTLKYYDKDGDLPDESAFKYSWSVGDVVLSTAPTVQLPNDIAYVGQRLILSITPVSISGKPSIGNILVLNNLNAAGATAGDGQGNIIMKRVIAEPTNVTIDFKSSASILVNGTSGWNRPVAGKDVLTAKFTPAPYASPDASDYTFQWKADGINIGSAEVGKDRFTPGPDLQGTLISVDVMPVKKTSP